MWLFALLQQRVLLLLVVGISAVAVGLAVTQRRTAWRGDPGFLEAPRRLRATPLWPPFPGPLLLPNGQGSRLHPTRGPGAPAATGGGALKEAPLLTFIDWGRGPTAPDGPEELLQQQHPPSRRRSDVCGVLYCTSWDPRSKALVSALKNLQQEALAPCRREAGGEDPPLPVYPIKAIRVNNSLVIARGRRALLKQRRMACNMKQLRHNERALRFMLQQQPPLQLHGLPALQLYTQQQEEGEETPNGVPMQLLEIRCVAPRALQRLGADERALLGAWGPQGPPGGTSAAGSLAAWLRRLGQLYEVELKRIVQERLQQAEEEYPIYKSYNP